MCGNRGGQDFCDQISSYSIEERIKIRMIVINITYKETMSRSIEVRKFIRRVKEEQKLQVTFAEKEH